LVDGATAATASDVENNAAFCRLITTLGIPMTGKPGPSGHIGQMSLAQGIEGRSSGRGYLTKLGGNIFGPSIHRH